MRIKIGSEVRANDGQLWRVTYIDKQSGLVELINAAGVRFHIPRLNIKGHGIRIGFFSRLFGKERKR